MAISVIVFRISSFSGVRRVTPVHLATKSAGSSLPILRIALKGTPPSTKTR